MPAPLVARPRRKDEGANRPPLGVASSPGHSSFQWLAGADLVVAWALLAGWMLVILAASGDSFSAARTGAWLAWFLRIGFGGVAPQTLQLVHLIVRKSAHLLEYCILGLLLYRALRRTVPGRMPRLWLAAAWLLPLFVATIDELHQLHVPSRTASVMDVGIDTLGGWLGLSVRWWSSAHRDS